MAPTLFFICMAMPLNRDGYEYASKILARIPPKIRISIPQDWGVIKSRSEKGARRCRRPAAARGQRRTRGMISHPSPRPMAAADSARRGTQPRSLGFRASVSWTAAGSAAPRRFHTHDTRRKFNAPCPPESGVATPALPPHSMTLYDQPQRVGVVRSFLCGFAPLRLGVETKRRTPLLGFAF